MENLLSFSSPLCTFVSSQQKNQNKPPAIQCFIPKNVTIEITLLMKSNNKQYKQYIRSKIILILFPIILNLFRRKYFGLYLFKKIRLCHTRNGLN